MTKNSIWRHVDKLHPAGFVLPQGIAPVGSIIPAGTPVVIGVTHDDIQIFSSGNTLTVVTKGEVDIDELTKRVNGECQPIYLCDIKGFQKSRGGFLSDF